MHYDVDYSNKPDADLLALEDICDYIGRDKFNELTTMFQARTQLSFEQFSAWVSLTGVQGFPVRAWYKHCYPNATLPN
jgi:hypothetical protein